MADNRDGGPGRREGWRGRDDSIFSDDDDRRSRGSGRWSSDFGRERGAGRADDERGFLERAGDELRSWFGDEEAERRRERDALRDEGGGYGGRLPGRSFEGGRGGSAGGRTSYAPGGSFPAREPGGQRSFGGGRPAYGGRSHWDENYHQWRDRQIEQFDREYEDYCRERQQQFEQEFDSWRGSRLTEGGTSGQYGGGPAEALPESAGVTGRSGAGARNQSDAGATSGALGAETAGAATAAGGSGSAAAPGGGSTGGRGGRIRS